MLYGEASEARLAEPLCQQEQQQPSMAKHRYPPLLTPPPLLRRLYSLSSALQRYAVALPQPPWVPTDDPLLLAVSTRLGVWER